MKLSRETMFSVVGAGTLCGVAVFASMLIVVWDVGSFRGRIEEILRVDFDAALPANTITQQHLQRVTTSAQGNLDEMFLKKEQSAPAARISPTQEIFSPQPPSELPALPPVDLGTPKAPEISAPRGIADIDVKSNTEAVVALRRKAGSDGAQSSGQLRRQLGDSVNADPGKAAAAVAALPALADPGSPEFSGSDTPLAPADFTFENPARELTFDLLSKRPGKGYPSLDNEIQASFLYEPQQKQSGFFEISFRLRPQSKLPTLPKDVLFIMDVSQSIEGDQISSARAAIISYIKKMSPLDRWNVVKFSEQAYSYQDDYTFLPPSALDERKLHSFIRRPNNEYMTDIFATTRIILSKLPRGSRPCSIFLISDGMANYSTWDVRKIVEGFSRVSRDNFSIFTFMCGDNGMPDLLRLLSYRSRGVFRKEAAGQPLDTQLLQFFRDYDEPVLSSCVASYTGLENNEVYPRVLPNLYRGQPITFYGRSMPQQKFIIRVMGLGQGGEPREFFFRPAQSHLAHNLAANWARGKVYDLEQQAVDTSNKTERERILQVLQQYIAAYNLPEFNSMIKMIRKSRN